MPNDAIPTATPDAPVSAPPPERLPAINHPAIQQVSERTRITIDQLMTMQPGEVRDRYIAALMDADIARQHFSYDKAQAAVFAGSGLFDDIKGRTPEQAINQAQVKIQLGR